MTRTTAVLGPGVTLGALAAWIASLRVREGRLASSEYRPIPLRLAEMEKKHGGQRLLLVPAVRDRVAQTAVAQWLGTRPPPRQKRGRDGRVRFLAHRLPRACDPHARTPPFRQDPVINRQI
ncbi:MAG: hypothetical protein HYX77_08575 [Acidobacteria bacterium]|nr:hypothetical protein [Acidobacteriota bacterium]